MDDLIEYIKPLYKEESEYVVKTVQSFAKAYSVQKNPFPNLSWYKFLNLYFIYPDALTTGTGKPLAHLVPFLAHIKRLGCNALHILPFLDSPLVDAGFDVRDYMKVRADLGTMNDIKKIVTEAHTIGIRLFMDLVANHVSNEHEWFQKAQAGDNKYRNYFIFQKEKPHFIKTFEKESAVWAVYLINGKETIVNVAFPEMAGEIPHWVLGRDEYWYYHTYYPQQLDLNWYNPDVAIEFAKIAIFWASLGFNFRLDAIPFIGKGAYKKTDEENQFSAHLVTAFKHIVESINPECTIIAETYEKIPIVVNYFGTSNIKESQLAYNFHLCTYLWVALVKGNIDCIWDKYEELSKIPIHAEWMNFLRNHDELSLAYLDKKLLEDVKAELLKHGEPFREGYGVSGRTYSLLGNNEKRFLNAYFLLASLPGGVLIPYGDEIGKKNIPIADLPQQLRKDTRNINRGTLSERDFITPKGKRIMRGISEILIKRQVLREYLNIQPERIPAPSGVLAGVYRFGVSELVVMVNITNQTQKIRIHVHEEESYKKILQLYRTVHKGNDIIMSPYAGIWVQK